MKIRIYHFILMIFLAAMAGWLGAYLANRMQPDGDQGLHDFVHDELALSKVQIRQLDRLEADFAVERGDLQQALRTANASLAKALDEEHSYGPKVTAAIDDIHAKMGDLQKATVRHILSMRALLDKRQKILFDAKIGASLTGPAPE